MKKLNDVKEERVAYEDFWKFNYWWENKYTLEEVWEKKNRFNLWVEIYEVPYNEQNFLILKVDKILWFEINKLCNILNINAEKAISMLSNYKCAEYAEIELVQPIEERYLPRKIMRIIRQYGLLKIIELIKNDALFNFFNELLKHPGMLSYFRTYRNGPELEVMDCIPKY